MSSIRPIDMSEQLRMLSSGGAVKPSNGARGIGGLGGGIGGIEQETSEPGKVSFGDLLAEQIKEVNQHGVEAERAIQRAVAGEEVNPHATVIAVQKASVSLTLMMSIKDRLERAYQEILRTPLG